MKHIGTLALALLAASAAAYAADLEIKNGSLVTIDGTTTNAGTLYVGRYDNGNRLVVTNGGTVGAATAYVGQYSDANTLLATGTNSALNVAGNLVVGESGKDNVLTVADGGEVNVGTTNGAAGAISVGNATFSAGGGATASADALVVGTVSNETGKAVLTGSGTELVLSGSAFIGTASSSNSVSISGGATLVVSNQLHVGSAATSNNTVTIGNQGEVRIIGGADVQNPGSNKVEIKSGGRLTYTGDANLDNAAANGFDFQSGSTLEIGGNLAFDQMDTGVSVVLNGSLNTNLTAVWDTGSREMYVGNTNSVGKNILTIKDGGQAHARLSAAHIGEKSNNNAINVIGENSLLTVEGQLFVGMQGDKNALSISDGGSATITNSLRAGFDTAASENRVSVTGTNSTLNVLGSVIVGEKGSKNSLEVTDATLEIGQSLEIGRQGGENSATISGGTASATVGADLSIGAAGSGKNTFTVEEGALLSILGDAYLGTNSADNTFTVTGTNSALEIAGHLSLGNLVETNSLTGNTLSLFDTANATVGGDLALRNGSILEIQSGSKMAVGGDYVQDATSELAVSVSTNQTAPNLAVAGTATFAANSTIKVYDGGVGKDPYEQTILTSSGLFIGTNAATTALLNDTNAFNFVNALLDIEGSVTNNSILLKTEFLSIAEKSGLVGTGLEAVANEIDALAQSGNTNAITMRNILGTELGSDAARGAAMDNYYGEKASASPANTVINLGIQSVSEQLTRRADNTRARMGAANRNPPAGAAGPHMAEQALQGWASGYGTWADKSAADGFNGYDATLRGYLIGADLSVAKNILVGLAGGSGTADIDKENGAQTDARSNYGAAYVSLGTMDWFFDASLIYAGSEVQETLGTTFDTEGEYDAQNGALYLGGGKEMIGNYFVFTPMASLLVNYYYQDTYVETSSNAEARKVFGYDTTYVQSSLGCNVGFYTALGTMVLKPELRAHWLHEFRAEEKDSTYRLVDSKTRYAMAYQAPEEDILKIGIGTSAKLGEYLELRADLDTRWASDYSDYTLLGSLRYQF